MTTPDLKPCPFCGGEPLLMQKENNSWYVTCNSCSASSKEHAPRAVIPWEAYHALQDAVSKAVDAWNRRANDEGRT